MKLWRQRLGNCRNIYLRSNNECYQITPPNSYGHCIFPYRSNNAQLEICHQINTMQLCTFIFLLLNNAIVTMQESIFVHIHYGNLMSYLKVLLGEEFRLRKKIYAFTFLKYMDNAVWTSQIILWIQLKYNFSNLFLKNVKDKVR